MSTTLGNIDFNWSFSPASGNFGGILNMWNTVTLTSVFSFSREGYSGVCLEKGVNNVQCSVVNIYSPCTMAGKRKLWEDLLRVKNRFGNGLWCLVGDFNVVRYSKERKGIGLRESN